MTAPVSTFPTSSYGELVGIQEYVQIPAPPAGADWTYTVPAGYIKRIIGGTAKFVTSAAVANRVPALNLTHPDGLFQTVRPTTFILATSTANCNLFPGVQADIYNANGALIVWGFPSVWMSPGWVISTSTSGLDVADQWSAIGILFDSLDFSPSQDPEYTHAPSLGEQVQHRPIAPTTSSRL